MTSPQERAIASELAQELCAALGPALPPEALTANCETVCEVFGRVFDRHEIVIESVGARILSRVPKLLAKNFKFAGRDRAVVRRGLPQL